MELEQIARAHLFYYRLFLYKATKCYANLVEHSEGKALHAEAFACLQRFEIQAVGAVVLTSDGDVLTVEHARVALHGPGQRLREGEVVVVEEVLADDVATQHALVALAGLGLAVAAQLGFQTHAQLSLHSLNINHCN